MRKKVKSIDINSWRGGKYVDRWMLVHFLGGLFLGFGLNLAGLELFSAFIIAAFAIFGWEVYEYIKGFSEPTENILLDILVGGGGFFLAYSFLAPSLNKTELIAVFASVVIIWGVLSIWGWRSYLRRRRVK